GCSGEIIEERLRSLVPDLDAFHLDAILLSHEHTGHISSIEYFSSQYRIPVLATLKTCRAVMLEIGRVLPEVRLFVPGMPFVMEDLEITPFSIPHDAADPVAFRVEVSSLERTISIGICTDLGFVTSGVIGNLLNCTLLLVESNHDPELVARSNLSATDKRRLLGRCGHLSNQECSELLKELAHPGLERIYLGHLSENYNKPELALKSAQEALSRTSFQGDIVIATHKQCSKPSLWD
uniref:MBL fold metallo-hydrolase n=1 Tax=Candidatus Similichlamydia epinepheli TaxID=1903953 RepID=UPI000D3C46C2